MYNSLVLAALLPLTGPTAGEQFAALSQPEKSQIQVVQTVPAADPGDRVPIIDPKQASTPEPVRATVAYAPDAAENEKPVPVWTPPVAASVMPVSPTPADVAETPKPSPAPAVPNPATPEVAVAPTAPSTFAAPPSRPNSIVIHGLLEVPQYNKIPLAANYQAQLMVLRTEQQGADGKTVLVPLREGMHVVQGQVLGKQDDRELSWGRKVAECELNVAKAEAEKKIEVEYATAGWRTAKASLAMLQETNNEVEGAVSHMDVIQAELKVKESYANYELQDYNLKVVKKAELDAKTARLAQADVQIELRQIVAPISGMIVKIEKAEGVWLREGDNILEIWQLNTLRLRGKVNAKLYTTDMVNGKAVSVTMPLINGKTEELPGKVVFADPNIVPGDEFEVFIEVQNRPSGSSWMMLPGQTVNAAILL